MKSLGDALIKPTWPFSPYPHNAAYRIHATSPVYDDGKIYITSGYGGQRGEMLELAPDGKSIKKIWSDNILDNKHGGVIALSGYVYGTSEKNRRGNWVCLNLSTGTMEAETAAVGMGSVA